MIVSDLIPQVQALLGGRTDIVSQIPGWIQAAIFELTESYPFEELRVVGPTVTLPIPSPNAQCTNPISFFLNPTDKNCPQVVAFSLYVDYPANNVLRQLDYRTPQVIDSLGTFQSIPIYWTRFGPTIVLAPPPQQPFAVFMRYQREHPFTPDIISSPVLMPASWTEIINYSAAERAASSLRSDDYIQRFHNILFGDPEYQVSGGVRGRPGLIAARTFQIQRDQSNNTRRLGIQVARYSSRH